MRLEAEQPSNKAQGCTNRGQQVAVATDFCTMAPNVCESSLRKFLHVTLLASTILRYAGFKKKKIVHPSSIDSSN